MIDPVSALYGITFGATIYACICWFQHGPNWDVEFVLAGLILALAALTFTQGLWGFSLFFVALALGRLRLCAVQVRQLREQREMEAEAKVLWARLDKVRGEIDEMLGPDWENPRG